MIIPIFCLIIVQTFSQQSLMIVRYYEEMDCRVRIDPVLMRYVSLETCLFSRDELFGTYYYYSVETIVGDITFDAAILWECPYSTCSEGCDQRSIMPLSECVPGNWGLDRFILVDAPYETTYNEFSIAYYKENNCSGEIVAKDYYYPRFRYSEHCVKDEVYSNIYKERHCNNMTQYSELTFVHDGDYQCPPEDFTRINYEFRPTGVCENGSIFWDAPTAYAAVECVEHSEFQEFHYCDNKLQTDGNVCSGQGECIGKDNCLCNSAHDGDLCQFFICEDDCNNNGVCVGPNTCICLGFTEATDNGGCQQSTQLEKGVKIDIQMGYCSEDNDNMVSTQYVPVGDCVNGIFGQDILLQGHSDGTIQMYICTDCDFEKCIYLGNVYDGDHYNYIENVCYTFTVLSHPPAVPEIMNDYVNLLVFNGTTCEKELLEYAHIAEFYCLSADYIGYESKYFQIECDKKNTVARIYSDERCTQFEETDVRENVCSEFESAEGTDESSVLYQCSDVEFVRCYNVRSTNDDVCSGHGECVEENVCECNEYFTGDECNIVHCNGVSSLSDEVCSSHGQCYHSELCLCEDGYVNDQKGGCVALEESKIGRITVHYKDDNCEQFGGYERYDKETGCENGRIMDKIGNEVYIFYFEDEQCTNLDHVEEYFLIHQCWPVQGGAYATYDWTDYDIFSTNQPVPGFLFKNTYPITGGCSEAPLMAEIFLLEYCLGGDYYECLPDDGIVGKKIYLDNEECFQELDHTVDFQVLDVCLNSTLPNDIYECKTPVHCDGIKSFDVEIVCNGNGDCIEEDTCSCESGWLDESFCKDFTCKDVSSCYGNGECTGPNECSCTSGWSATKFCKEYHCNDVYKCHGHGACIGPNKCSCILGWQGDQCETEEDENDEDDDDNDTGGGNIGGTGNTFQGIFMALFICVMIFFGVCLILGAVVVVYGLAKLYKNKMEEFKFTNLKNGPSTFGKDDFDVEMENRNVIFEEDEENVEKNVVVKDEKQNVEKEESEGEFETDTGTESEGEQNEAQPPEVSKENDTEEEKEEEEKEEKDEDNPELIVSEIVNEEEKEIDEQRMNDIKSNLLGDDFSELNYL